MTDPAQKSVPKQAPARRNATLDKLAETYAVFRDCKPLALGIHKVLLERQPELGKDAIRKALHSHTASTRYLKSLATADQRFDLDGQPTGEVTEEQRKQALVEVKERIKKANEKRKAEEATKERQAKLEKLADKFNAR
jgi:ProP effector